MLASNARSNEIQSRSAKAANGVLHRFWQEYLNGLESHPVAVKSLTSFCGFFIADQLAQAVTGVYLDHKRLARMLLFALTVHGPMCHFWYKGLDDAVFPNAPKSPAAIVLKIFLDQALFAPVFLVIFWFVLKLFEGRPTEAYEQIVTKMYPTLLVSYTLWPIAHVVNFRFIPGPLRLLYINIVTVFWTTYLSWSAESNN